MRAFITGINGFIGSNLATRLIAEGQEVSGLVRKTSNLSFLERLKLELFSGDLSDKALLDEATQGVDIVYHVAGRASDWGPIELFRKVNVEGTKNLMESSLRSAVKRFVFISSAAVHGFRGFRDATEDSPKTATIFPYCITKKEAEDLVNRYHRERGLPTLIIRPGNVFGPRDRVTFVKMAELIEKGQMVYINGGRPLTCPTYVGNLLDAILLAVNRKDTVGETFIITDGLKITWKEYMNKIAEKLGARRPLISVPYPIAYSAAAVCEAILELFRSKTPPIITRYRIANVGKDYHFNIEKARTKLGYQPRVSLDEAMERTVEWYKSNSKYHIKSSKS
ncbi:NAD-dependent epimerase/dehydratase family protein [bacterium]|nr:NAD-dependent epimerase/dehydratase family protein [bacterium]NIO18848.1 NAD-dependent epimerase/dehydratase family protein [bacterium]